jgi:hypothetical protein
MVIANSPEHGGTLRLLERLHIRLHRKWQPRYKRMRSSNSFGVKYLFESK